MRDQAKESIDHLARTLVKSKLTAPGDFDQANQPMADVGATALRHAIGSLICGDYVILDKLGQGSMGQVFKAMHRHLDRIVALKVLNRSAALSPETVERFRREAEVVANLDHPNIVRAYDARGDDGQTVLVMEFVDGVDLATLVQREGALPIQLACQYALQAARGLAHAHAMNIVHRDVKPSNLIVDSAGIVKVLDLGVARLRTLAEPEEPANRRLTDEGQVLGTIAFMAPEQAQDSRRADQRSDVYSLGCTLYYLLTQSLPFSGATISDTLEAHQTEAAPALKAHCPDVPEELQQLFEKAVAKDASQRHASMNEFIEDLERCIKHGRMNVTKKVASPRRAGSDSSPRWRDKRVRQSQQTVSDCNRRTKASKDKAPPAPPSNRKKTVVDSRVLPYLVIAACSVVILTLISLAVIALRHRERLETGATADVQRPQSSRPAPTLVNRGDAPNASESTQEQASEDSAVVRVDSPPSPSAGLPDSRQVTETEALPQIEPRPRPDPPSVAEVKLTSSPADRKEADAVPIEVERKIAPVADEPVRALADSHGFLLTLIVGKRKEKLSDLDAAVARLQSFIEVRDSSEERRVEPLPFVATVTVDDQLFEADTPDLALRVCRILQSAESGDHLAALTSRVAGEPVDLAGVTRKVDAYVQQHFPRQLDQWAEDKKRMPTDRDVRRIVLRIISLGKSNNEIPAYFDYQPTTLELDSLLGEMLHEKSERFKRKPKTQPPPPPPPGRRPPRRNPPPR